MVLNFFWYSWALLKPYETWNTFYDINWLRKTNKDLYSGFLTKIVIKYSISFYDLESNLISEPEKLCLSFQCHAIITFPFPNQTTPCSIVVRYHSKSIFYNNTFIILGLSPIPQTITFLSRVVGMSVCSCHFPPTQGW